MRDEGRCRGAVIAPNAEGQFPYVGTGFKPVHLVPQEELNPKSQAPNSMKTSVSDSVSEEKNLVQRLSPVGNADLRSKFQ